MRKPTFRPKIFDVNGDYEKYNKQILILENYSIRCSGIFKIYYFIFWFTIFNIYFYLI